MKLTIREIHKDYNSNPCEVLPVWKEDGMHLYVYFHVDTTTKRDEIVKSFPHDYIEDVDYMTEGLLCITLAIPTKGCKIMMHE